VTISEGWRKILQRLRSGADRLTHSWDRKRARARLRRRGRPQRIIIICYGNICRSPYAAAFLRKQLEIMNVGDTLIESAGLIGPDRPANQQGLAIAMKRGLDLSGHRSRLLQRRDALASDLVLVMTHNQRDCAIQQFGSRAECTELLGDFDTANPPGREISDPYGKSDDEFDRVFTQIERSIKGLCASWS
jgi:protein-tyrosine phosphatase